MMIMMIMMMMIVMMMMMIVMIHCPETLHHYMYVSMMLSDSYRAWMMMMTDDT